MRNKIDAFPVVSNVTIFEGCEVWDHRFLSGLSETPQLFPQLQNFRFVMGTGMGAFEEEYCSKFEAYENALFSLLDGRSSLRQVTALLPPIGALDDEANDRRERSGVAAALFSNPRFKVCCVELLS